MFDDTGGSGKFTRPPWLPRWAQGEHTPSPCRTAAAWAVWQAPAGSSLGQLGRLYPLVMVNIARKTIGKPWGNGDFMGFALWETNMTMENRHL